MIYAITFAEYNFYFGESLPLLSNSEAIDENQAMR